MLAKIPDKRDVRWSSFADLVRYIARCEDKEELVEGGQENLLAGEGEQIASAGGIACFHNCLSLDTAAQEMEAVARHNGRVKDPVYHLILSWPEDENPDDQQIYYCALDVIERLHMRGHQFVMAVHRDTENTHVHLAINRVHPETYKVASNFYDYIRLDYIMREMEIKYGWKHDNGVHEVVYLDGKPFIRKSEGESPLADKLPPRAAEMEAHFGTESLLTYARTNARAEILSWLGTKKQKNWSQLHDLLARHGLGIKPKGQGLVIFDAANATDVTVKASAVAEALGKQRLEKLLGSYVAFQSATLAENAYDKARPVDRDSTKREIRRLERALAKRMLRERYLGLRKGFVYKRLDPVDVRMRFAAIRDSARQKKEEIRRTVADPDARKALYGVVSFIAQRDENNLRLALRKERAELKNDPSNRFPHYRDWVQAEAEQGDAAAISQLRGWTYSEKRRENQLQRPELK